MEIVVGIVIAVVAIVVICLRGMSAPPEVPPLPIHNDDPDMKAARAKAQATLGEFVELYRQHPNGAMVKWPFVTSSGETENLAAEVLALEGESLRIQLVTPPVTHTGKVERLRTIRLNEIVDWVIMLPGDKRKGGFTMRVMFKVGRERWGDLPPKIKAEEAKYVD